jgi:hypothetical protein
MHSGSLRGNAEPTGSVLKNTLLPPSSFQKQPFGLFDLDIFGFRPAYVFPLATAAASHASSVAIRKYVEGHLVLLLGPHA